MSLILLVSAFRWCILTLFIHILRTYIDSVRIRCLLFIPCSCIAHATFENESLKKNVTSHKGILMMSTRFYSRFQGVLSSSTTQCNKLLGWKYSVEKRTTFIFIATTIFEKPKNPFVRLPTSKNMKNNSI